MKFICDVDSKPHETCNSLQYFLDLLPKNDFIQVHKCSVVRMDAIIKQDKNELIMKNYEKIKISRTYIDEVNKRLEGKF